MVSIIVPIYNVEEYVDKCVESLVQQTYKNIEILLIDDGSTDQSWSKCLEWEKKDQRIRIFHKNNEGLGETRNFGVDNSIGEYITFVDSDDWAETTMVEKLLLSLVKHDADISICDRYQYSSYKDQFDIVRNKLKIHTESFLVSEYPDCIADISTVAYAKMYRRSLITDNHIRQPKCEYEDVIVPVMIALAKKIAVVTEPLYCWLTDRKGSITNSLKFTENIDYLKILLWEFQNRNLYIQFQDQICRIMQYRSAWNYQRARNIVKNINLENRRKLENYRELSNNFFKKNDIVAYLEDHSISSICVIGSYNLMIAAKLVGGLLPHETIALHYSYSSIISMMSERNPNLLCCDIQGKNEYRTSHIAKDFYKSFQSMGRSDLKDCSLIFVDFLEERFPVGKYDNTYITISDVFLESTLDQHIEYEVIDRFEECFVLWKKACMQFIELLSKKYPDKKIVLVKTKLAEDFGTTKERKKFNNYLKIRKINEYLENCYQFFSIHCPEAIIVNIEDAETYYTDENFRHGCEPFHLNNDMFAEMASRIRRQLVIR